MATYSELIALPEHPQFGSLVNKIRVACVVAAVRLLNKATPTAKEVEWALAAVNDPATAANGVLWYVIGTNKSATVTQIVDTGDGPIQTNVDAAVDKIVSV